MFRYGHSVCMQDISPKDRDLIKREITRLLVTESPVPMMVTDPTGWHKYYLVPFHPCWHQHGRSRPPGTRRAPGEPVSGGPPTPRGWRPRTLASSCPCWRSLLSWAEFKESGRLLEVSLEFLYLRRARERMSTSLVLWVSNLPVRFFSLRGKISFNYLCTMLEYPNLKTQLTRCVPGSLVPVAFQAANVGFEPTSALLPRSYLDVEFQGMC